MDLPPVPADLKVCLARRVSAPPAGKIKAKLAFATIAELKADNDAKRDCGVRLICWIEDLERGLAPDDRQAPVATECKG